MTEVVREPLCPVSYCPAPSDPDWHRCWVCGALNIEHQHVDPRRMGGSPSRRNDPDNIAALCSTCHKNVTLSIWSDAFLDLPTGRVYRVWDLKNNTIAERPAPRVVLSKTISVSSETDGHAPPEVPMGINIPSVSLGTGVPESTPEAEHIDMDGRPPRDIDGEVATASSRSASGVGAGVQRRAVNHPALRGGEAEATTVSLPSLEGDEDGEPGLSRGQMGEGDGDGDPDRLNGAGYPAVRQETGAGGVRGAAGVDVPVVPQAFPTLTRGMPYEDYEQACRWAGRNYRAFKWLIGELILFGQEEYGEAASQVWHLFGFGSERTADNYLSMVRAFPDPDSRARELVPGVAQALAPIARQNAQEGAELVERALSEDWDVATARAAVRAHRGQAERSGCSHSCGYHKAVTE